MRPPGISRSHYKGTTWTVDPCMLTFPSVSWLVPPLQGVSVPFSLDFFLFLTYPSLCALQEVSIPCFLFFFGYNIDWSHTPCSLGSKFSLLALFYSIAISTLTFFCLALPRKWVPLKAWLNFVWFPDLLFPLCHSVGENPLAASLISVFWLVPPLHSPGSECPSVPSLKLFSVFWLVCHMLFREWGHLTSWISFSVLTCHALCSSGSKSPSLSWFLSVF